MNHPFGLELSKLEAFWSSRFVSPNFQRGNSTKKGSQEPSEPIATTLALGEEGGVGTTEAFGEEGGVGTTEAFGEEGGATTDAVGEDGGVVTTYAVGEEGGVGTTDVLCEGGGVATTEASGEEGGVTTLALGEEGGELPLVTFERGIHLGSYSDVIAAADALIDRVIPYVAGILAASFEATTIDPTMEKVLPLKVDTPPDVTSLGSF